MSKRKNQTKLEIAVEALRKIAAQYGGHLRRANDKGYSDGSKSAFSLCAIVAKDALRAIEGGGDE